MLLVHLHPPTVTVYFTVPPLWPPQNPPLPASSSPLVMRLLPPAEWFISHLIWTAETELNPQRGCCLSLQKTPSRRQQTFLKSCSHFPAYLIYTVDHNWEQVLDDWCLLSDSLSVAISTLFSELRCALLLFDVEDCGMSVRKMFWPLESIIGSPDAVIMEGSNWD